MKKLIYISLILPLILYSCESEPNAMFSVENAEPEVGQEVIFTNESDNANRFEWNFGDGYGSDEADPVHIYTGTGTFEVIMTAYSKKGLSSQATVTIKVMIPTLLEIEVVEWYQEYVVPGASVILYPTLQTWLKPAEDFSDIEAEGYTDDDGIVVFSHLGPYVYYVDVWEATHDNYKLAAEDVGFIRTSEIMPHKINRFTAWVDVADHSKGEGRSSEKSFVIKKIERKPDEKGQYSMAGSNSDWKELYARSIKVN
jgi:PKD repeat protein